MAYPPVPGWLPPPSAKLESTWLSGRALLSQFRQAGIISQKRSNGGDTFLPQHRFLVAMMVRFSSASLRQ
jgi:hypothetical protein